MKREITRFVIGIALVKKTYVASLFSIPSIVTSTLKESLRGSVVFLPRYTSHDWAWYLSVAYGTPALTLVRMI